MATMDPSTLFPQSSFNISDDTYSKLSSITDNLATDASRALDYESSRLKDGLIIAIILTAFLGLFTVLAAVATYILTGKGLRQAHIALMFFAIAAMWVSTTAYWVTTLSVAFRIHTFLRNDMERVVRWTSILQRCVASPHAPDAATLAPFEACDVMPLHPLPDGRQELDRAQYCAGTVALTVNVLIGDAIVWWRAWVLWRQKRLVSCVCAVLILATTAMAVMDTKDVCSSAPAPFDLSSPYETARISIYKGTLFAGDRWGMATTVLSLVTNCVATLLIAYRAWQHRALVKSHLRQGCTRTKVERTLALLVESGVLYCALWVIVIIYELVAVDLGESAFAYGFYYVMGGCLVPLIGMYPTLIIILCALNQKLRDVGPLAVLTPMSPIGRNPYTTVEAILGAESSTGSGLTIPDVRDMHTTRPDANASMGNESLAHQEGSLDFDRKMS